MLREIFKLQNRWRFEENFYFELFERDIFPYIVQQLKSKKIVGLIGSRQVGKSSLLYLIIQHLIKNNTSVDSIYYFNLDDLKLHELFQNIPSFLEFLGKDSRQKFVFIDEIQRLPNPGLFLKEIYDLNLNIKIFYSGSSQLEIKTKLKEHLVGRVREVVVHRLSFDEVRRFNAPTTKQASFDENLIFGSYPGVVLEQSAIEKKLSIKDIYQSYIEKDVTDFLQVKNITAFNKLIALLAHQSGSLLNINSLSKSLAISRSDVERYIDMLEDTFIIKRIYPFFRNYKKEITKTPKIYFLDNGLRNYAINNFNPLELRHDVGNLFENFYLLHLLHSDIYGMNKINFWRTTNQTEIDFIIETDGVLEAIEIKWNKKSVPKSFATLHRYYPEIETKVVTKEFFLT